MSFAPPADPLDKPRELYAAWRDGTVSRELLAQALPDAWACLYPNDALPADKWRELFDATGFISDGHPATLLDNTIRLYRQAPYQHRFNWSWSDSVIFAHYATFGRRQPRSITSPLNPLNLWACDAPAEAVLMHVHYPQTDRADEWNEWVVDTAGLTILPVYDYAAEERRFLARPPIRLEHKA